MKVNLTGLNGSDAAPFPSFLPLQIFDDTEYDCRTPQEWLQLGVVDNEQKPVPGKALLPTGWFCVFMCVVGLSECNL